MDSLHERRSVDLAARDQHAVLVRDVHFFVHLLLPVGDHLLRARNRFGDVGRRRAVRFDAVELFAIVAFDGREIEKAVETFVHRRHDSVHFAEDRQHVGFVVGLR